VIALLALLYPGSCSLMGGSWHAASALLPAHR
jgi:hypothetical protein